MNDRSNPAPTVTGLVAILRGVTPGEVDELGEILCRHNFTAIEVPLNSPDPFRSIEQLRSTVPPNVLVGAGTVLTVDAVRQAKDAGSDIVVSPNCDTAVIEEAVRLGMTAVPGVATVSEAFEAVRSGARALKLFPSHQVGIDGMRAWADVLPPYVEFVPVGGVGPGQIREWVTAGATGFGLGSSLYSAGRSAADVETRAAALAAAWAESSDVLVRRGGRVTA